MNLKEVVDVLCEALDARDTGCEIEVAADEIRILRTFPYASRRDLLITDVLRAIVSPNWVKAISDAQQALQVRIDGIEAKLKAQEAVRGVRLGSGLQKSSLGSV